MQFNSLAYAIFLCIVFFLYWWITHKYRWIVLLLASYYFYGCWNVKYLLLILIVLHGKNDGDHGTSIDNFRGMRYCL